VVNIIFTRRKKRGPGFWGPRFKDYTSVGLIFKKGTPELKNGDPKLTPYVTLKSVFKGFPLKTPIRIWKYNTSMICHIALQFALKKQKNVPVGCKIVIPL
jgi:hypothetical protein